MTAIGVEADGITVFASAGFDALSKGAFATTCSPGAPGDAPLRTLLAETLGGAPSASQMAAYRRLYFEAHTLAAADL